MYRLALSFVAAAVLSACTSMHQAPAQTYRPKNGGSLRVIQGEIVKKDYPTGLSHMLTITVNGAPAISGPIGGGDGDIGGTFEGLPMQALCNRQSKLGSYSYSINCRVVVDGEFVSTLTF